MTTEKNRRASAAAPLRRPRGSTSRRRAPEEHDGVGIARGPGLGEGEHRLLVGLLRVEQAEIIDVAEFQPPAHEVEAPRRGALGGDRLLQRDRIRLDRAQRVGDVLEGGDHRAAILRQRLVVGGDCGPSLRGTFTAMENRL